MELVLTFRWSPNIIGFVIWITFLSIFFIRKTFLQLQKWVISVKKIWFMRKNLKKRVCFIERCISELSSLKTSKIGNIKIYRYLRDSILIQNWEHFGFRGNFDNVFLSQKCFPNWHALILYITRKRLPSISCTQQILSKA